MLPQTQNDSLYRFLCNYAISCGEPHIPAKKKQYIYYGHNFETETEREKKISQLKSMEILRYGCLSIMISLLKTVPQFLVNDDFDEKQFLKNLEYEPKRYEFFQSFCYYSSFSMFCSR